MIYSNIKLYLLDIDPIYENTEQWKYLYLIFILFYYFFSKCQTCDFVDVFPQGGSVPPQGRGSPFVGDRSRFILVFTKKVSPEREPNVSSFGNFTDNCDSCEMLSNTDKMWTTVSNIKIFHRMKLHICFIHCFLHFFMYLPQIC